MSDNINPQKWQIYTAADPTVERIIPGLAVEIGLNESIVLMQISFWINRSNNVKNGVYWTFQSLRDMKKKAFPYWSIQTIQRAITNLSENGYILVGNFNKRKGDKTQWFALNPDKLSSLTSVLTAPSREVFQDGTPMFQDGTTLPETPTKEKEKPFAPNGAGTSPAKQAKANPLYDAVEAVWGYTAARNGAYGKMLTGVATGKYKPCNVEPGMTPDEIREWAAWWKSHNQGLTMLAAPDKVQSSIYEWRKRKANPAPKVTELYERPTQEEIDAATSVYGALKFDENGMFIGVTSEKDANPVWTPIHLR